MKKMFVRTSLTEVGKAAEGLGICEMFALVRYKIDNKTVIVPTRNIKDFCPVTLEDFNPDVLYKVFWSGNTTTKGGYYEAQIVNMAGMVIILTWLMALSH